MPYLEIDGSRYYYAGNIAAEGIPVLFCHGSGGRHHHWLYQLRGLSKTINPIAVDLPGHGRSEGTPFNAVPLYRDWLKRFKETAGLGPVVLGGHSLGGAIALSYALQYPDDILSLLLIGTGARLRVLPKFLNSLKEGIVPTELFEYLYGTKTSEELLDKGRRELETTAASIYYADLSACDNFDIMEELPGINQLSAIICGSEDRLTPVKYSRYLHDKLPQSRLEVIDGAGHMVMLEQPEAVNRTIARFIEEEIATGG